MEAFKDVAAVQHPSMMGEMLDEVGAIVDPFDGLCSSVGQVSPNLHVPFAWYDEPAP